MKSKCVQEGEYLCIGTCVALPHALIDKAFERDDKMKDMQWYYNTVKGFETMSSVD